MIAHSIVGGVQVLYAFALPLFIYYHIYIVPYSHKVPWWVHFGIVVNFIIFATYGLLNVCQTLSLKKAAYVVHVQGDEVFIETPWAKKLHFFLDDIQSISQYPLQGAEKWLGGLSYKEIHHLVLLRSGEQFVLPGTIERIDELLKYLGKD